MAAASGRHRLSARTTTRLRFTSYALGGGGNGGGGGGGGDVGTGRLLTESLPGVRVKSPPDALARLAFPCSCAPGCAAAGSPSDSVESDDSDSFLYSSGTSVNGVNTVT